MGRVLLSGGDFISLAAIADAEKAIANGNRNNGKNILFIIILPVNTQIILAIHILHTQLASNGRGYNSSFCVVSLS
ncbi:hypothetical protein MA092_003911 [Salmonella enterica]|nr:hypothetical protein [Salmonella enterica]